MARSRSPTEGQRWRSGPGIRPTWRRRCCRGRPGPLGDNGSTASFHTCAVACTTATLCAATTLDTCSSAMRVGPGSASASNTHCAVSRRRRPCRCLALLDTPPNTRSCHEPARNTLQHSFYGDVRRCCNWVWPGGAAAGFVHLVPRCAATRPGPPSDVVLCVGDSMGRHNRRKRPPTGRERFEDRVFTRSQRTATGERRNGEP